MMWIFLTDAWLEEVSAKEGLGGTGCRGGAREEEEVVVEVEVVEGVKLTLSCHVFEKNQTYPHKDDGGSSHPASLEPCIPLPECGIFFGQRAVLLVSGGAVDASLAMDAAYFLYCMDAMTRPWLRWSQLASPWS